jgi:hypothetical protein
MEDTSRDALGSQSKTWGEIGGDSSETKIKLLCVCADKASPIVA